MAPALSVNVTVPSLTVLVLVTVALNVTELPGGVVNEGLLFDSKVVVVAAAEAEVVVDRTEFLLGDADMRALLIVSVIAERNQSIEPIVATG